MRLCDMKKGNRLAIFIFIFLDNQIYSEQQRSYKKYEC